MDNFVLMASQYVPNNPLILLLWEISGTRPLKPFTLC